MTAVVSPTALQPVEEICDARSEIILNSAPALGLASPGRQNKSEPTVTVAAQKDCEPQQKDAPSPVAETHNHAQVAQQKTSGKSYICAVTL